MVQTITATAISFFIGVSCLEHHIIRGILPPRLGKAATRLAKRAVKGGGPNYFRPDEGTRLLLKGEQPYASELNFVSRLALKSDHAFGVFRIVVVEDRLAIEDDHVVVAIR